MSINTGEDILRAIRRRGLRRRARIIGRFVLFEAAVAGFVGGLVAFYVWTPSPWLLIFAGLSAMAAAIFWHLTWSD